MKLKKDAQLERLRRKRDQEWELAGPARQDGDKTAAAEHTEKAREYAREIAAYMEGQ
jgi:hypothetical protein